MGKIKISVLLILLVVLLTGCAFSPTFTESVTSMTTAETAAITESTVFTEPAEFTEPLTTTEAITSSENHDVYSNAETTKVQLVFAGDNLIHEAIYNQAKTDNGYNFDYIYRNVVDLIEPYDLAVLNQETIVTDKFNPSTYPNFCSPGKLGDKMVDMGFDVISIANNHVLDKGEEGLKATLEYWRDNHPNIPVYGAYESQADMENIRTFELNGITFAFVGFMEHTNGLFLPEKSDMKLVYLDDIETVQKQIEAADRLSDVVVVSVHYGIEVANEVSERQYELTDKFVQWGADLIIGTQSHTVQTMQYLEKPHGGQAFVFYCLGNFISAMESNKLAIVGMLGYVTVEKDSDGLINITQVKSTPIISHYEKEVNNVCLYPYSMYTEELAKKHFYEIDLDFIDSLIRENIPDEFLDIR